MNDETPKTLTCPSCGAPLEFDGRNPVVRCQFCKTPAYLPGVHPPHDEDGMQVHQAVPGPATAIQTGRVLKEVQDLLRQGNKIEAIKRYREATDVSMVKATDVVDRVEAALQGLPLPVRQEISRSLYPVAKKTIKTGAWLGCAVTAVIVLFVGGILALTLSQPGGPFVPRLIANGPAGLVKTGDGLPSIAAALYDVNKERYGVGLLSGDKGKLLWQVPFLTGANYLDAVLPGSDVVYATAGADLLALRTSDGSTAWQAVMPDRLNYSESSLLVTGSRVIANNADQSIQAYDAANGRLVWSRRLAGYDRSLRMIGSSLVLFDYAGDDYVYSLFFLDPVDGSQQRVLTPGCATDEFSSATLDPEFWFSGGRGRQCPLPGIRFFSRVPAAAGPGQRRAALADARPRLV